MFLFTDKPNPVDRPILSDPECDDGCDFVVSWNRTDYFYSTLSLVNYVVYISRDGIRYRPQKCINVHSTHCIVHYEITEVEFGMYAAAVQTVFYYDDLVPDRTSDLSNFSNVVQLDYSSYPSMYIVFVYFTLYIHTVYNAFSCVNTLKDLSYLCT